MFHLGLLHLDLVGLQLGLEFPGHGLGLAQLGLGLALPELEGRHEVLGQFRRVGKILLVAQVLDLFHRLRGRHQFRDRLLSLAFQLLIELHVDVDRQGLIRDRDTHRLELGDESPFLGLVTEIQGRELHVRDQELRDLTDELLAGIRVGLNDLPVDRYPNPALEVIVIMALRFGDHLGPFNDVPPEAVLEPDHHLGNKLPVQGGRGVGTAVPARDERGTNTPGLEELGLDPVEVPVKIRDTLPAKNILDLESEVMDHQPEICRQRRLEIITGIIEFGLVRYPRFPIAHIFNT